MRIGIAFFKLTNLNRFGYELFEMDEFDSFSCPTNSVASGLAMERASEQA